MKTRLIFFINFLLIFLLIPHKNFTANSGEKDSSIYFKKERNHWIRTIRSEEGIRILGIDNNIEQVIEARKEKLTSQLEDSYLFMPYVAYFVGSWPEAVAIDDVNGDGLNDVVMTTTFYFDAENDYKLFVFLQNSDGILDPPVKYDAGNGESVDIGDLNHDGKNDVVVTTSFGIGVLLQNDNGSLAPMILYYATNDPSKVRIDDYNFDGLMDVASIGWGGQSNGYDVNVFLQNASGTLNLPNIYIVQHRGREDLEVEDINCDGLTDIIVMGDQYPTSRIFGVLYQYGLGGFFPAIYYNLEEYALLWGASGVAAGDINEDILNDVVVTYGGNWPNSFIGVYFQNAGGMLDSPVSYQSYDCPGPVVIGDVNDDHRQDVIVAHGGWQALGVYIQDQYGSLMEEKLYYLPYATRYNTHGLAIGDINGDSKNDVVLADYNHGLVVLYSIGCWLTITSGEGGTTNPSPGTYACKHGIEVSITAVPNTHFRFKNWSGDISSIENPLLIITDSDKSIMANFERVIYAPLNFTGNKELNRSLYQAEYITHLKWQANSDNENIVKYRIYMISGTQQREQDLNLSRFNISRISRRDRIIARPAESRSFLVELDANIFEYWHRNVDKDNQYTYEIVAVNSESREGDPATVIIQ